MKTLVISIVLLFSVSMTAFAGGFRSGDELIAGMHKKYEGKWYRTLTFVQKTTNFKPDGTTEVNTWYEAMSVPGKLRIDFEPLDKHDGIVFADGKIYSFRDGKTAGGRAFVHPLLVLGFDLYHQTTETSIAQVKGLGVDLSMIHVEKWQGRDTYVVGAKQGDLKTPQFWVDKKNLYFVRLIQLGGKDKKSVQETQFNKYFKSGGGWVSPEVVFMIDGKTVTTEEYTDVRTGMKLDPALWDPEKWLTVKLDYWK